MEANKLLISVEDYYFDIRKKPNKNFVLAYYYSPETIDEMLFLFNGSIANKKGVQLKILVTIDFSYTLPETENLKGNIIIDMIANERQERAALEKSSCLFCFDTEDRKMEIVKAMACGSPALVPKDKERLITNKFTVCFYEDDSMFQKEKGIHEAYKLHKEQPFHWISKIDASLNTIRNLTTDNI